MFINALAGAIDAAHPKQFDYLSRQLWQAHAAGHIPDQDAQSLAERLHSRRGDSDVAQGALFRIARSARKVSEAATVISRSEFGFQTRAGPPWSTRRQCGGNRSPGSSSGW